jgi:Sugar transferases involved in lipopolysaccharide synthesis
MHEADICPGTIERRAQAFMAGYPLAGSPIRRGDVLKAIETTCSAVGDDLSSRQVDVDVRTREGALTLGLTLSDRFAKRAMDLLLTALLLPFLLPLFAVVALLVKLTSPGPVLFRQRRVGFRGREFHMYKFRTMFVDAEQRLHEDAHLSEIYRENGYKVPAHIDPRQTKIGKTLRSTSLDELPQLLNVIRGNMSLVGPRPVVEEQMPDYGHVAAAYTASRPGITGMWQVSGRSDVSFPLRAHLDVENLRNWTLLKDLRTLIKTIPSVLRRTGAY